MHRLERNSDPKGGKPRDRHGSMSGKDLAAHRQPNGFLDLFGALEMAIGDNFDTKDIRKFTGENPAEWLIYKRICVSRISSKACMDVITPTEEHEDDEYEESTRRPTHNHHGGNYKTYGHRSVPYNHQKYEQNYNTNFSSRSPS
jgi:hypothetical protein